MTDEQTPITPEEPIATPPAEALPPAEEYVKSELAAARTALHGTKLYGSIMVVLIGIYLIYVAAVFSYNFQPAHAAEVVSGMISDQIESNRDTLVATVSGQAKDIVQQAPDQVINQFPAKRQELVSTFETELSAFCDATTEKLDGNLDLYIDKNKDKIKMVLDASEDDNAKVLGTTINAMVMEYLKTTQPDGKSSIISQIKESQTMLQDIEKQLHRLATAKNLTPAELKTRRAIAVIANSVNEAELQQIKLPQITAEDIAAEE